MNNLRIESSQQSEYSKHMAAESPRVERQPVDMDVPGSVRPRKVEAEAEAELLLSFAEARVQELELLCQNTSQRITSAKAAAQRWRQIAIRMQLDF